MITRSNKSDPNDRRERDRDREREPLSEKVRGPKEKDKEGKHREYVFGTQSIVLLGFK